MSKITVLNIKETVLIIGGHKGESMHMQEVTISEADSLLLGEPPKGCRCACHTVTLNESYYSGPIPVLVGFLSVLFVVAGSAGYLAGRLFKYLHRD